MKGVCESPDTPGSVFLPRYGVDSPPSSRPVLIDVSAVSLVTATCNRCSLGWGRLGLWGLGLGEAEDDAYYSFGSD